MTDRREDPPGPGTLTVVVPCHNEELNIPALYDALKTHMAPCVPSYEIIFVDDGSTDRTVHVARELMRQDPGVRLVWL
ncbi:MAG: glycosyltransferase, partial [Rhodoplanes sp.]